MIEKAVALQILGIEDPITVGFVNNAFVKEGSIQDIIDKGDMNFKVDPEIIIVFCHKIVTVKSKI